MMDLLNRYPLWWAPGWGWLILTTGYWLDLVEANRDT